MKNREPTTLASALAAAAKAGKLRMSIRMSPYARPLARADARFKHVWQFLKDAGAAEWDRIEGLAAHFHPDYTCDPKTRELTAGAAPGHVVFEQMERGEYDPDWIKATAPTIWQAIVSRGTTRSRGKRGLPDMYRFCALHLAAMLSCHEYANLQDQIKARPQNRELIARHLYWFERFSSMWVRIGVERPPTFDVNVSRRAKMKQKASDVLSFHQARVRNASGRKVSAMESAKAWAEAKGVGWRRPYDALRAALRNQE